MIRNHTQLHGARNTWIQFVFVRFKIPRKIITIVIVLTVISMTNCNKNQRQSMLPKSSSNSAETNATSTSMLSKRSSNSTETNATSTSMLSKRSSNSTETNATSSITKKESEPCLNVLEEDTTKHSSSTTKNSSSLTNSTASNLDKNKNNCPDNNAHCHRYIHQMINFYTKIGGWVMLGIVITGTSCLVATHLHGKYRMKHENHEITLIRKWDYMMGQKGNGKFFPANWI